MEAHRWPNEARVAVIVSVLLESWSEGKHPAYFPRSTPLKPGAEDLSASRWSEYGGNEGIWRLTSALKTRGIPAAVFANALSAERYPDAIGHSVNCGFDVAGHGYAQDQNLLDYSLPRLEQADVGGIVAIPWSEFVDNRVQRGSPRAYFEVYKDTFDYLYAREPGSLLHVAIHAHFGGRPLMAAMLHKILDYFSGFTDVWFARHAEIARWTAEQQLDRPLLSAHFKV